MIHFSFSSVLMTVLVSNLLLILLTLLFRNENVLAKIGYRLMAVFCVITLVRLMLPFELPFANTVAFPSGISYALAVIRHRYDTFLGIQLSIWDVFCIIWLTGSIACVSVFFYRHWSARRLLRGNSVDVTEQEPYATILRELCSERQLSRIRLRMTCFVDAPMILGLWNPIILMPVDMDPSDSDIMYALRHEIYHYVHHDMWLTSAVNCLVAAYWWNFFTRQLSKQISVLLEMRVDNSIISEGEETSIGYLSSILHYLKGSQNKEDIFPHHMGLSLKKKNNLAYRIRMIQSKGQKPHYLLSIAVSVVIVTIYIGSYLVIFENSAYAPELKGSDTYILQDSNNCYAIQNTDGTYTVYIENGKYTEVVNFLDYYPDITIYSSKEEYDEAIQNQ